MNDKFGILGHFIRAFGHLAAGAEQSSHEGRADSAASTPAPGTSSFNGVAAPAIRAKPIIRSAKPSCCVAKRAEGASGNAVASGVVPRLRSPKR